MPKALPPPTHLPPPQQSRNIHDSTDIEESECSSSTADSDKDPTLKSEEIP